MAITLSLPRAFNRLPIYPIGKVLRRRTDLYLRDYASLLHLCGEYLVRETKVDRESWLANKKGKLRLRDERVAILGYSKKRTHQDRRILRRSPYLFWRYPDSLWS